MGRYNYHSHTTRCGHVDSDYSDEDFVKEYVANGFTDLAFTDHMPQKHRVDMRHGIRMDYSQLEDYLSSVEYLKEKYKDSIKILSGFEGSTIREGTTACSISSEGKRPETMSSIHIRISLRRPWQKGSRY